ncbi:MAG: homoserine kinase [Nitriliruptoraceae bacterium]
MTEQRFAVRVPATSANLGAGFDAFGIAVTRYLFVAAVDHQAGTPRVRSTGEGAAEFSTGDDNLIWRSFVAFCDHHGLPIPSIAFEVANDIPAQRGLGSSSAAIVAGISLARAVTAASVAQTELVELANAIEGHPDNVGPALLGGFVTCTETDDRRLAVRRVNPAPWLQPVIFVPSTRQSTEQARAQLSNWLPQGDVVDQLARAGHTVGAMIGSWQIDHAAVGDRLHEPARSAHMPASGELLKRLRDQGVHAWLSGAGPSVMAMLARREHQIDELAQLATVAGFVATAVDVDLSGALVCPTGGCGYAGGTNCVQCPRMRV